MSSKPQSAKNKSNKKSAAEKESELRRLMREMRPVLVAYSGGVDSSYLAHIAASEIGRDALCVMGLSPSVSEFQRTAAAESAASGGFDFITVDTYELVDKHYSANPANRCYFCKSELYGRLGVIAAKQNIKSILDGTNADDLVDHRPGRLAAGEKNVRSPLAELGFTKDNIREQSRIHGLPSWDKPASPCLSSRIAYGVPVTIERLSQVEKGEQLLRGLGFTEFRVRVHDNLARIEIVREELTNGLSGEMLDDLNRRFKKLGFKYVTLDLEGFRSGSMNVNVPNGTKRSSIRQVQLENR